MADFSSYTHKWRATTNNDHRDDGSKVSKRNRQPVSCVPCRTRKLKCDRGHPCDSCTKRGDDESCVYGKLPASNTNGSTARKDDSRANGKKAQDRLRHLEELVKRMIEPGKSNQSISMLTPPDGEEQTQSSPAEGTINRENEGTSYAGSTHWSAILEHIHELKQDLGSEEFSPGPIVDISKPDSLFGAPRPPSLESVLQNYLPARIQVDRRVSQYFNAKYMIIPFIHMKQFQRQYERFWEDPLNTSPIWVSLLFSLCCLAASLSAAAQTEDATPPGTMSARDSFQTAAGQCLILGNYSKPQPFIIEALALFLQCKYAASLDPSIEVALIFSIQTRLAFIMGYHRDGSNFPHQFTPFESELRRRTWAMMKQFDLMVSFQMGIPSTVPPRSWDTDFPHNLRDTDFDEDCSELPAQRSDTEPTQILYFAVKSRLVDIMARVCQQAISFLRQAPTNAEIMALDKELRQSIDLIPSSLQYRRISESITDPGYLIMVRLNISFLWKKSLCILHRKPMASGDNDYSYNACVDAASSMCESMLDLHPEFQIGGLFENDRWMVSSFTIMDFLLACMVLSLILSVSRKKHVNVGGSPQKWLQLDETKRLIDLLERSQAVCVEFGTRSKEAKRVSVALRAVLDRLRTKQQGSAAGSDGARYFLNMTGGTMSNTDNKSSTKSDKQDSISMTPLSLAEKPTSITPDTGMFPPENFATEKLPATYLGQISFNAADNAKMFGQTPSGRSGFTPGPGTPWPVDSELGPLSSVMDGFDGTGNIDWAQFDQFTGPYGGGFDAGMGDVNDIANFADFHMQTTSDGMQYGTDWESTPHRFLGGSIRDPLTGTTNGNT